MATDPKRMDLFKPWAVYFSWVAYVSVSNTVDPMKQIFHLSPNKMRARKKRASVIPASATAEQVIKKAKAGGDDIARTKSANEFAGE